MRKLDIARQIAQQARLTERDAVMLLEWILDLFKATLHKGEPIAILNFGKFTVRRKSARRGRNPKTGQEITIAARRVVIFRPGSQLKAATHAL